MVDRFSGLRCRPGNLAVIVQDEPECGPTSGRSFVYFASTQNFRMKWDSIGLSSRSRANHRRS